ncbi:MAG TPA: M43 family zinc metalloprotease [Bacteroidia bacterium]|nr:M43 family zinc metalloprotease [Bacteroidia bacterium]
MNFKSKIIIYTFFLLSNAFLQLYGQKIKCGTTEYEEFILSQNPELRVIKEGNTSYINSYLQSASFAKQRSINNVISIPVIVHLIGNNVIAACGTKVQEQINILNNDYRKMIGTNGNGNGVDTKIQFCLATNAPNGTLTNGIDNVMGTYPAIWQKDAPDVNNNSDATLKNLSHWPPEKYLNLYVVEGIQAHNSAGQLIDLYGYATFPWELGALPFRDGVVIDKSAFGLTTGYADLGRTATHEIGHWLGLFHTFQGGCANTDCKQEGDYCCDTPPVAMSNFTCNTSLNSCHTDNPDLPDQVQNYMDYSPDACMNMFTQNQGDRMYAVLNSTRYYPLFSSCIAHCNNKIKDANETGVDCGGPDCLPCNHCTNKIQDAGEFGIDCGGPDCPPCQITSKCSGEMSTAIGQCVLSGTSYKCGVSELNKFTISSSSSGGCMVTSASNQPVGRSACVEINILPEFSFTAGTYVYQGTTYTNSFQLQICGGPIPERLANNKAGDGIVENVLSIESINNYSLSNFPNPFYDITNIHYSIQNSMPVKIEVYDIFGKKIKTLIDTPNHSSGDFDLPFDGSNLSPGIYIYIFQTNGYSEMKKMILLK